MELCDKMTTYFTKQTLLNKSYIYKNMLKQQHQTIKKQTNKQTKNKKQKNTSHAQQINKLIYNLTIITIIYMYIAETQAKVTYY